MCSGPISSGVGLDYIACFGTKFAENIGRRRTKLRENGVTLCENSPITSARNHIRREHPERHIARVSDVADPEWSAVETESGQTPSGGHESVRCRFWQSTVCLNLADPTRAVLLAKARRRAVDLGMRRSARRGVYGLCVRVVFQAG